MRLNEGDTYQTVSSRISERCHTDESGGLDRSVETPAPTDIADSRQCRMQIRSTELAVVRVWADLLLLEPHAWTVLPILAGLTLDHEAGCVVVCVCVWLVGGEERSRRGSEKGSARQPTA